MANIYFKNVKLKNFMSYEEAEIKLNRKGYVVVKGINSNPEDAAKSNGAGKSTIFSAVSWCLTGETVNGAKNVSNIYLEGSTSVQVEFELDEHNYIIERTKNPSNLFITIDGENKSGKGIRDTEEIVKEYLPQITHNLINSVIILGQGLPQRFTNNTPSGRKEVLEKLSNSDFMIDDIKSRLQLRKDKLTLDWTNTDLERAKKKGELSSTNSDINNLETELTGMDSSAIQNEISELEVVIKELEENIEDLNVQASEYENLYLKAQDEYDEYNASIEDRRNGLTLYEINDDEINDLTSDIKALKKELVDKQSIKEICPTCGQRIPGAIKPDTSSLEAEISEKENNLVELKAEKDKLVRENNDILTKFKKETDSKVKELLDIRNQHREEFNKLDHEICDKTPELNDKKLELVSWQTKLAEFENTKISLENKIAEKRKNIIILTEEINELTNRFETLKEHLDVNSKMFTLIKRDFRGYLLTNVVDFIQSRAKVYCNDIFGTTAFEFGIDGNNIVINYDGKEYEVLSGGEKQKIDVIIQLSLRDMLCRFLNFSSNILVLDEITDSLDITGAQRVFDMISGRLSDVEAIYIISHHTTDFDIPEDDEIVIEKGCDKISRIV